MPTAPRADRRDFYALLDVPRTATQDEIQRAYRKLARQHHPDVNKDPGAEDRFKEISEAYDVLSDPQTRRRYDAFGPDFRQVPEDVDPEAFQGGHRSVTLEGPGGRRTLDVRIPAGVANGQRIRLAGQGGRGSEGAPNGDLYFVVQIAPHPRYRVDGRDLYVDLPLAPWEAALGTSVAVETPGGEMKVKVPPGTSSGKRLRLRERGLPHPRGRHGHLYAEVKIMVPAKLTDEERRLFEQLAATSAFDPRSR